MAAKKPIKKEVYYLASWNARQDGAVVKVTVKCKKVGDKYVALDKTTIPDWADIITLS